MLLAFAVLLVVAPVAAAPSFFACARGGDGLFVLLLPLGLGVGVVVMEPSCWWWWWWWRVLLICSWWRLRSWPHLFALLWWLVVVVLELARLPFVRRRLCVCVDVCVDA